MKKHSKIFKLLFCLLIAALNFSLIIKPLNLVTGGTQGVALLMNYFINIKPSTIILIINLLMLLISYFTLKKETTKGIIVSTFAYPLFIRITTFLPAFKFSNNVLLPVIIAGIICGFTNSFILKLGYSTGGINILVVILKKYLNIKESISTFAINTIIIVLGAFSFGYIKALYSIVLIIISSIIIHKILYKNQLSK